MPTASLNNIWYGFQKIASVPVPDKTRRADIFAWVKKLPETDWSSTWGSELSEECTDAIAAARECPTLTYFEGRCEVDKDFMNLLTAARAAASA